MLWIIIGAIAGLVIGIAISSNEYFTFGEGFVTTLCTMVAGVLTGLIVFLLSSCIADCCAEKTYYTVEDTDIYALQDNMTTEGRFFLGSGHIDNELKYFYVKQTDVGYTISNVDVDNAYIQYTSDRCYVEKQQGKFNNWFVRLIAEPMDVRYIFHIPEGSIINNYSIDLR